MRSPLDSKISVSRPRRFKNELLSPWNRWVCLISRIGKSHRSQAVKNSASHLLLSAQCNRKSCSSMNLPVISIHKQHATFSISSRNLIKKMGITVILATHRTREVAPLCDHVWLMDMMGSSCLDLPKVRSISRTFDPYQRLGVQVPFGEAAPSDTQLPSRRAISAAVSPSRNVSLSVSELYFRYPNTDTRMQSAGSPVKRTTWRNTSQSWERMDLVKRR